MSKALLNRCSGQLCLSLTLFALWGFVTSSGAADEVAYTNPVYRWSVSYPSGWKVNAGNLQSVTFHGTVPAAILGIHAIPDAGSKSLDDAASFVLRAYPLPRYVTVSRRNMTLPNGFSAIEVVHHIGSGKVGKSRKVITVAKGRAFMIDAEAYLDSWNVAEPYFNRIIDSFTVQDSAQTYPTKPIRLVVGFDTGGAADIIARAMSDPLSRALGQSILVENKPGAGSSLAAAFVAKAAPDGYTIMIASQSGMIINPIVNKNISYDTERDFVAITQVTSSPLVVAVHPSLPVNSIRELIAEAKKNPGKLNFATSGNGSLPHLATALFDALAGVEMVHIPYKSGGLSVQSVLAGDTQVTFATAPSVMPHVHTGKLRGLAVTTRGRSPLVEGLPGMEEAGLANYDVSIWYGFFAPKATPPAIVARLFEATTQALQDPKLKAVLAPAGTEAVASQSPADFGAFLRRDAEALARVIRETGVKFE